MARDLSPALEGRLLAMRKILAALLAGQPPAEVLEAADGVVHDLQEDPGAVSSEGFALEAALAEEMRLIAQEARRRRENLDETGE